MPARMEPFLHHLKLEQTQSPLGAVSSQGGKGPSSGHIPPSAPCPGTLSFLGSVWERGRFRDVDGAGRNQDVPPPHPDRNARAGSLDVLAWHRLVCTSQGTFGM